MQEEERKRRPLTDQYCMRTGSDRSARIAAMDRGVVGRVDGGDKSERAWDYAAVVEDTKPKKVEEGCDASACEAQETATASADSEQEDDDDVMLVDEEEEKAALESDTAALAERRTTPARRPPRSRSGTSNDSGSPTTANSDVDQKTTPASGRRRLTPAEKLAREQEKERKRLEREAKVAERERQRLAEQEEKERRRQERERKRIEKEREVEEKRLEKEERERQRQQELLAKQEEKRKKEEEKRKKEEEKRLAEERRKQEEEAKVCQSRRRARSSNPSGPFSAGCRISCPRAGPHRRHLTAVMEPSRERATSVRRTHHSMASIRRNTLQLARDVFLRRFSRVETPTLAVGRDIFSLDDIIWVSVACRLMGVAASASGGGSGCGRGAPWKKTERRECLRRRNQFSPLFPIRLLAYTAGTERPLC
uniref:Uncharacterized protein n=1 Tax=Plectus sambesii TaxID=2011161 RepID=A0A914V9F2_9BILA